MRKVVFASACLALMISGPPVAAEEPAWGTLTVKITQTPSGQAMPGKVILLHAGSGKRARLLGQSSRSQVVRPQAAYTINGTLELPVLPGDYRILAGRGMEYSVADAGASVPEGGEAAVHLALRREVETPGYVPADLHLHTIFSDGNPSLAERVIALAGEGIKFAAATDHNYVTDYSPVVAGMGAGVHLACVAGDEVTTWGKDRIGHFCAYPVPAGSSPIPATADTGRGIFAAIRSVPGKPIMHVTHPRWDDGAYFTHAGVGLFTGRAGSRFDPDFDVVEIMNEDRLWGWILDPRVREDWFNLLNRGFRFAAIAVSDSHGVWHSPNGMPRTYVASASEDPKEIDAGGLMEALRRRRCTAASGIYLELEVNGVSMGGEVSAAGGKATARIRVRSPGWIRVDTVQLLANGEPAETLEVPAPPRGEPTNFETSFDFLLEEDSWVLAIAWGPDVEHPLYPRPVHAQAATNPVWVDADGDGSFQPILAKIRRAAKDLTPEELWLKAQERPLRWIRMLVGELYDRGGENAGAFLKRAALSPGKMHAAFIDVAEEEEGTWAGAWKALPVEASLEEWGRARAVMQMEEPAETAMTAILKWEDQEGISLVSEELSVELAAGATAREEMALQWPADAPPPRVRGRALVLRDSGLPGVEKLAINVYPVMSLARLGSRLRLDGKLGEWGNETRVPALFGDEVGEVMVALAGDAVGFAARVKDGNVHVPDARRFWEGDYLEIFLDTGSGRGKDSYRTSSHHIWICPATERGPVPVAAGRWHHDGDGLEETVYEEAAIRAVCRSVRGGYILEGAIPISLLAPAGKLPERVYFNYKLCDKWTGAQFFSSPGEEDTHNRPGTWGVLLTPSRL